MSSTIRNKTNPKHYALDYYPTPNWVVHRLLEKVNLPSGVWFEPCAGDGAIIKAVNSVRSDIIWDVNEIQHELLPKLREIPHQSLTNSDYLQLDRGSITPPKVIITNPPFNLAMECVQKSLSIGAEYVVCLLRLNFLSSQGRAKFMAEYTPDVYVLSTRPSFTADQKRDSIDYAWFVWDSAKTPNTAGKLVVIPNKDKL